MIGVGTRWFLRELERRERQHTDERARWDTERRQLIDTICVLAGRSIGAAAEFADTPDSPDGGWSTLDEPDGLGGELVHMIEPD